MQFAAIATVQFCEWDDLQEEVLADEKLRQIMQELISDPAAHAGYQFKKGRLTYKGKLVVPKGSSKIPLILHEFHDSVSGGHSSFSELTSGFQLYYFGRA